MSWLRLSLFISYKPTRLEYVTWFGNVHQICLAKICLSCHCSFLLYRSLIYDSDLCLSLYNVQCTHRHRVGMQWIICHASLRKIHKNYLKTVRSPCDAERERNVMATRKLHIVRLWNLFNFCDEIPNICRADLNSKWQQSDPLE